MFTASGMHALSKCGHFLQQWFEWGMFAWVTDDCCYCLLLFDWCFLSSGLLNNMNTLTKIIGLLGLFSCCSLAPLSYLQSMTPKFFFQLQPIVFNALELKKLKFVWGVTMEMCVSVKMHLCLEYGTWPLFTQHLFSCSQNNNSRFLLCF